MHVNLRYTKVLLEDVVRVLKVVLLAEALVEISDWHQMALYHPSNNIKVLAGFP